MVRLSVVMSVWNGAASLESTLQSILAQTEKDFELIVVDDGSTDDTPRILAAERDPRLRVITQENAGLTRALIRGCLEARADAIARHDNGDRSHPERFAKQLALLEQGHVLVSCATRYVTSEGDELYVASADGEEVRRSLLHDPPAKIHGIPSHPSAMFRRDAYLAAGGYRPQFRTAQDLDLWIRLARRGTIGIAPEVLFEVTMEARGISGTARASQVRLTEIAAALRDGGDEASLLEEASRVRATPVTPKGEAAGLYFIGKCLRQQNNPKWRRYVRDAARRDPLHWRAWASLILGRLFAER
jgi:glycosyltransferase involved in cell wall biosynthesis